jgi:hypothetical protein
MLLNATVNYVVAVSFIGGRNRSIFECLKITCSTMSSFIGIGRMYRLACYKMGQYNTIQIGFIDN